MKTPEWHYWRRCDVFIVNFETYFTSFYSVSIVNFERVNAGWDAFSQEWKREVAH